MAARNIRRVVMVLILFCGMTTMGSRGDGRSFDGENTKVFLAGAVQVDITPRELPVIVSGYFLERTADTVRDPLYARAFVLDDGTSRVAICVVDTLFMPRELVDKAKHSASEKTGIGVENMLVSATHTHTAPSVAGALGTGVDENYRKFLPGKIAEAIELAHERLEPARIGWTAVDAPDHTHCRRWILRPDKIRQDVFGRRTVRANMHPGYQNPDFVGPAGPADTELSLLSVQSREGRPVAVLANYSMHFFGSSDVSADYFGRFSDRFTELIDAVDAEPKCVVAMSQGTSGDLHWNDYSQPKPSITLETYSEAVAQIAAEAYKRIEYQDWCPLDMTEKRLTLRRRVPDRARLSWARDMASQMEGRQPKNRPEVYALEQLCLHEDQKRELKLQVVRIGNLGIAAFPCEVYGITGLKIKAQSPLEHTFNIELANGSEGYIPPPEQHILGGYTTWPARSAALEVAAEPRIVQTLLSMLEDVASKKRRPQRPVRGTYDEAVLRSQPLAYWCLDEIQGSRAMDATGNSNHADYGEGVAFYLSGPAATMQSPSRCAHFAGGRVTARLPQLGRTYSVAMWIWNGLPTDARAFTGFFLSRAPDSQGSTCFDRLGIGGTSGAGGKLIFAAADPQENVVTGTTEIPLRKWCHVALVRDESRVRVYLNGRKIPEIEADVGGVEASDMESLIVGGCSDGAFGFEGKIAKVAVFNRLLTHDEIARHYEAGAHP